MCRSLFEHVNRDSRELFLKHIGSRVLRQAVRVLPGHYHVTLNEKALLVKA